MFANFAAKRHFNGPLRAVSPVADDYAEIDWKLASKQAKKYAADPRPVNPNTQKLIQYISTSFKGKLKQESLTYRDSCELMWIEAVSLLIPFLYIASVLLVLTFSAVFFSEPMVANFMEDDYLTATYWACPAVLSLGLLYVLLRPIFGGFRSYHGRVLTHQEAPALFELVNQMSRYLNVQPPKRIEINNETALRVDAYAGVNSIYRDEYKIIIGAPLLMSMSLNELSAMIAHELSHFRNKQKKVAFYLMHHVSEWLYFRASGQDKRHQHLLSRMQKENIAFYEYAELWVWQRIHLFQQWVFMGLYRLHGALTAWKCRQIEFETDQKAIALVGDEAFKAMFFRLRQAQFSQKAVSSQNDWAWKDGFLLDNYALAVALEARKLKRTDLETVKKGFKQGVSVFCPSDAQRMQKAKKQPGLLKANVFARHLLESPNEISKQLTILDYESSGIVNAEKYAVSSEKIRVLKEKKDQALHQARRYFDGRGDNRILKFEPTDERDVSQFDIQRSIDHIRNDRVEDRKHQTAALNLFKRIEKAYIIERLRASKLPVYKYLSQEVVPKKDAQAYLEYMQNEYGTIIKKMEVLDQVFYQRAHECMNLLVPESRLKLMQAFQNLELYCQVRHDVAQLQLANKPLAVLVNGLTHGATMRILQAGVTEKRLVWNVLQALRSDLANRPIKVMLHGKPVHIIRYLDYKLGCLPEYSEHMSIISMADYAHEFLQLLDFQYHKWQSQLAVVFNHFERNHGIAQVNLLNR